MASIDTITVSPVTDNNKILTQAESLSGGDMLKGTYDSDNSGVVDNSELVNGLTVETSVPTGAVFTDTAYNDSDVLKDADTVSPVTSSNKLLTEAEASSGGGTVDTVTSANANALTVDSTDIANPIIDIVTVSAVTSSNKIVTQTEIASSGGGDMLKSVYDTTNNGIVDNAEKVNNLTVLTAVPLNALFTDTVYDDTSIQAEVTVNTAKVGITPQQASDIITNNAKVSDVAHPLVETAVPSGALFTDTIYDDTAIQAEVALNTAKVGITTQQASDITANNAKVSYTDEPLVAQHTSQIALKIDSDITGIAGATQITNEFMITRTAYDALPVRDTSTHYLIDESN